jgi:hypothetical protein
MAKTTPVFCTWCAIATLGLTGFRISELCKMSCSQVDLPRARFKIPDAKTEKGVREVEMTAWNKRELLRHREQRLQDDFPMGPNDHFFGTLSGGRRDRNRFRDRVLGRSVELANKKRSEAGQSPLPKIAHWANDWANERFCFVPALSRYPLTHRDLAFLSYKMPMEPTGIEPVTSCLQSRRSPS